MKAIIGKQLFLFSALSSGFLSAQEVHKGLQPIDQVQVEPNRITIRSILSSDGLSIGQARFLLEEPQRLKSYLSVLSEREEQEEIPLADLKILLEQSADESQWREVIKRWHENKKGAISDDEVELISQTKKNKDNPLLENLGEELLSNMSFPRSSVDQMVSELNSSDMTTEKLGLIALAYEQNGYAPARQRFTVKEATDRYFGKLEEALEAGLNTSHYLSHVPRAVHIGDVEAMVKKHADKVPVELHHSFQWRTLGEIAANDAAVGNIDARESFVSLLFSAKINPADLVKVASILEAGILDGFSGSVVVDGKSISLEMIEDRIISLFSSDGLTLPQRKLLDHHTHAFNYDLLKDILSQTKRDQMSPEEMQWWVLSVARNAELWTPQELSDLIQDSFSLISRKSEVEQLDYSAATAMLFHVMLSSPKALPKEEQLLGAFFRNASLMKIKSKSFPILAQSIAQAKRPFPQAGSVLHFIAAPQHGGGNFTALDDVIEALERFPYPLGKTLEEDKIFRQKILESIFASDAGKGSLSPQELNYVLSAHAKLGVEESPSFTKAKDDALAGILEKAEEKGGRQYEITRSKTTEFLTAFELFTHLSEEKKKALLEEHGENLKVGMKNLLAELDLDDGYLSLDTTNQFLDYAILEHRLWGDEKSRLYQALKKAASFEYDEEPYMIDSLEFTESFQKAFEEHMGFAPDANDILPHVVVDMVGWPAINHYQALKAMGIPFSKKKVYQYGNMLEELFDDFYNLDEAAALAKHQKRLDLVEEEFPAYLVRLVDQSDEILTHLGYDLPSKEFDELFKRAVKQLEEVDALDELREYEMRQAIAHVSPEAAFDTLWSQEQWQALSGLIDDNVQDPKKTERAQKMAVAFFQNDKISDLQKVGLIKSFYDSYDGVQVGLTPELEAEVRRFVKNSDATVAEELWSIGRFSDRAASFQEMLPHRFAADLKRAIEDDFPEDMKEYQTFSLSRALSTANQILLGKSEPRLSKEGTAMIRQAIQNAADIHKGSPEREKLAKEIISRNFEELFEFFPEIEELKKEMGVEGALLANSPRLREFYTKDNKIQEVSTEDWKTIILKAFAPEDDSKFRGDVMRLAAVSPENLTMAIEELATESADSGLLARLLRLNLSLRAGHDSTIRSILITEGNKELPNYPLPSDKLASLSRDSEDPVVRAFHFADRMLATPVAEIQQSTDLAKTLGVDKAELDRSLDPIAFMSELSRYAYLERFFSVLKHMDAGLPRQIMIQKIVRNFNDGFGYDVIESGLGHNFADHLSDSLDIYGLKTAEDVSLFTEALGMREGIIDPYTVDYFPQKIPASLTRVLERASEWEAKNKGSNPHAGVFSTATAGLDELPEGINVDGVSASVMVDIAFGTEFLANLPMTHLLTTKITELSSDASYTEALARVRRRWNELAALSKWDIRDRLYDAKFFELLLLKSDERQGTDFNLQRFRAHYEGDSRDEPLPTASLEEVAAWVLRREASSGFMMRRGFRPGQMKVQEIVKNIGTAHGWYPEVLGVMEEVARQSSTSTIVNGSNRVLDQEDAINGNISSAFERRLAQLTGEHELSRLNAAKSLSTLAGAMHQSTSNEEEKAKAMAILQQIVSLEIKDPLATVHRDLLARHIPDVLSPEDKENLTADLWQHAQNTEHEQSTVALVLESFRHYRKDNENYSEEIQAVYEAQKDRLIKAAADGINTNDGSEEERVFSAFNNQMSSLSPEQRKEIARIQLAGIKKHRERLLEESNGDVDTWFLDEVNYFQNDLQESYDRALGEESSLEERFESVFKELL